MHGGDDQKHVLISNTDEGFTLMRDQSSGDSLKLVLAGDIRKSDDPGDKKAVYGNKIQNLVKGRKDIILTGTIPPIRMPDLYTIGDVFVLPAIWDDPFPTALVEAAAAGLPIVTTKMGGIPEFIEDGVNGILLEDAQNTFELAEKISMLLGNRQLADTISRKARKVVESSFSWQRVTNNFEEFYLKALNRR